MEGNFGEYEPLTAHGEDPDIVRYRKESSGRCAASYGALRITSGFLTILAELMTDHSRPCKTGDIQEGNLL